MRYFTLGTLLVLTLSLAGVAPADTVESLAKPAPQMGPFAEPGGRVEWGCHPLSAAWKTVAL